MAPLSQGKFTIVWYIVVDGYCQNFSRIGLVVLFWPRIEAAVSADFRKMEKEQYRSVIRFLFLEGKSRSEIKERLDAVYGDSSPSMATVKNWFNEFQRGRTSVCDEPRPGAPKTATTEDNVTKIHDLVSQNDHRALLCRIIQPIRRRIAEKTAPFGEEKSALPPWQRTGSHLRRRHDQIGRISYELLPHPPYSPDLAPYDFFLFPNMKVTRQAEICVEWVELELNRRHGGLLCSPPENVFFRRVKEVGASLGEVYRAKRRLC